MGDGSKVDIKALAKFGKDTNDSMDGHTKELGSATGKIAKGTVAGGALGTNEAQTFNDWYSQCVADGTTKFMADFPKGMMALGFGAIVQAGNYAEGDMSQAKAMDEVIDMFNQAANKGLDGDLAKHNKSLTDKTTVTPLPPPQTSDDTAPPTNVCLPKDKLTPMQQLQLHNDQYGKWETWTPPDPNAQPDPIYSVPLGPGMI